MSLKGLIGLIFIAGVIILIFWSCSSSRETDNDIKAIAQIDGQSDLMEMTPAQTFRMALKNAMPEIKFLIGLLFLLFVAALIGLKRETFSEISNDTLNRSFAAMISRRPEKLAAIEEGKRIQSYFTVDDKETLRRFAAEYEKKVRNNK